jgi:signal transduction histidine kinase
MIASPQTGCPASVARPPPDAGADGAESSPALVSGAELAGARIIVVDDGGARPHALAEILRREGGVVAESVSDDLPGLVRDFSPHLVIVDCGLPPPGALEICRRLKAEDGEINPILLVVAPGAEVDLGAATGAGATDILRAPFSPGEAVIRVRHCLRTRTLGEKLRVRPAQGAAPGDSEHDFLGKAAHELRNPLSSIRGLADFMREASVGRLNAEQLELVNAIYAASNSMLSLVNDLLDAAAIDAGRFAVTREDRSLTEVLESAVYLATFDASKKTIRLALTGPAALPTVSIDANRLRQVADNLLSNAVKYSPPGATVTVELFGDDRQCGFGVKDQGPGIPEHERDRLFQDFGRLSVSPTGGERSTGLGLAICRKIVEAHDGSITAHNLAEGGCEFRVSIPHARVG